MSAMPPDLDRRPQFDHLILAVPDATGVVAQLRDEWGLHAHPDGRSFANGLANLVVPLEPPEYLEILYVGNAEAFAGQPDDEGKRRLLAGGGLLGWGLRTWDIAAVGRQLDIEITADMLLADGTRAPWTSIERPDNPLGFPFYIQYDSSAADRMQRWTERTRDVQHGERPGRTLWVEAFGDEHELRAWLAPARHLDIRITAGAPALRAAVPVGDRLLVLSSDVPGGIEPAP